MITNLIIILLISIACFGISIFSITGSDEVHKNSQLRKWGQWWESKTYSSGNKWKNYNRANGERFPFSSTLLSAFTDAWHMGVLIAIIGLAWAGILTGMQAIHGVNFEFILTYGMLWVTTYGIVFNSIHHYWLTKTPIPDWQWLVGILTVIIIGALGLQHGILGTGLLMTIGLAPIGLLVLIKLLAMIYFSIKRLIKKYDSKYN